MVPFKYGLTAVESTHSWVFCRVQAFSSQAAPSSGTSFLRVGEPVVGFIEPTNRKAHSAQLTSWDRTTPEFWRLSSPASFPIRFDLNSNAIYRLPQLSAHGFSYLRPPKCNVLRFETPVPASAGAPPAEVASPDRSKSRGRSKSRAPRNPKTPSWHSKATEQVKFEENPATASEPSFNKFYSPTLTSERVL